MTIQNLTQAEVPVKQVAALAPAPIKINWPNGTSSYLAVEDGVYPGEAGDWEVWLEGEPVAWADTKAQAERSFTEMAGLADTCWNCRQPLDILTGPAGGRYCANCGAKQ